MGVKIVTHVWEMMDINVRQHVVYHFVIHVFSVLWPQRTQYALIRLNNMLKPNLMTPMLENALFMWKLFVQHMSRTCGRLSRKFIHDGHVQVEGSMNTLRKYDDRAVTTLALNLKDCTQFSLITSMLNQLVWAKRPGSIPPTHIGRFVSRLGPQSEQDPPPRAPPFTPMRPL